MYALVRWTVKYIIIRQFHSDALNMHNFLMDLNRQLNTIRLLLALNIFMDMNNQNWIYTASRWRQENNKAIWSNSSLFHFFILFLFLLCLTLCHCFPAFCFFITLNTFVLKPLLVMSFASHTVFKKKRLQRKCPSAKVVSWRYLDARLFHQVTESLARLRNTLIFKKIIGYVYIGLLWSWSAFAESA